jgi:hypothetical protein
LGRTINRSVVVVAGSETHTGDLGAIGWIEGSEFAVVRGLEAQLRKYITRSHPLTSLAFVA